jgi:FAD synthetase
VLLILYLYGLHAKGLTQTTVNNVASNRHEPIQCVYIQSLHPFQEVEDFVAHTSSLYGLSLEEYAKSMKAAFADYLHDKPSVKAIFVGTRRTDPHGADLTHFDPTDHGWPKFMRIHPVIDWHYVEIWTVSAIRRVVPKHMLTYHSSSVTSRYLIAFSMTADTPP